MNIVRAVVIILVGLTLVVCDRQEEQGNRGTGGETEGTPTPSESPENEGPTKGPDEQVRACLLATKVADATPPAERSARVRKGCAALFSDEACRTGLEGLKVGPEKQQIVELLATCTKAPCQGPEESRPPLCGAELEPEKLNQSIINQWVRLGADVITEKRTVPLSWGRSVVGMMASDWNLPEDPTFLTPQGKMREVDLRAQLKSPDSKGFVLEIGPLAEGELVGSWKLTHDPRNNDVENAIEGVETKIKGHVIGVDAEKGMPFMSIIRVSTALRVSGARDVPRYLKAPPNKAPAETADDGVVEGDGPVLPDPPAQPDGGPES